METEERRGSATPIAATPSEPEASGGRHGCPKRSMTLPRILMPQATSSSSGSGSGGSGSGSGGRGSF
ncbi:GL26683 [Drosophila persimilis]|uniref:GL26683 n=1 Tax=Drosophila persimilis TaxID=7234 RepID=B4GT89_DROPE|nr:GL26683 [Drosophila persimilis]